MKGKIVRTTTAKSTEIKGYTPTLHTLKGYWMRVSNVGNFVGSPKVLGTQNGFMAVHKKAGSVFVITTGEDKGFWRKLDPADS